MSCNDFINNDQFNDLLYQATGTRLTHAELCAKTMQYFQENSVDPDTGNPTWYYADDGLASKDTLGEVICEATCCEVAALGGSDDAVPSSDSSVSSSNSDIGGIVGGVVGGVVVLSGLVALGLCAFKRSQDKKKKAQPTLTAESAQKQPVEAETSQVTITRTITISQGGDKQAAGPSEMPVATSAPPTEMPVASPQSMAALLAACGLEQHTGAFEAESYTLESLLGAMNQGDDAAMRDLRALKLNMGECRKLIQAATETRPASGSMDVAVLRV